MRLIALAVPLVSASFNPLAASPLLSCARTSEAPRHITSRTEKHEANHIRITRFLLNSDRSCDLFARQGRLHLPRWDQRLADADKLISDARQGCSNQRRRAMLYEREALELLGGRFHLD